jgi:hypothetical protein
MAEQSKELQKLVEVANDMMLSAKIRAQSIDLIGKQGTHESLLALLALVANTKLTKKERESALKQAGKVLKTDRY